MKIKITILMMAVYLSGCSNFGYVKSGDMVELKQSDSLVMQAEEANKGQYKLEYKRLSGNESPLIDDIPVGAIIPHFGPWNFSERWMLCMGQKINDPESPLFGQVVPDLDGAKTFNSTTYLAGTFDRKYYHKYFGRDDIAEDGKHTHSGQTKSNSGRIRKDNDPSDSRVASNGHTHDFSTSEQPDHNHGAENRPKSYGLVFLIKIK